MRTAQGSEQSHRIPEPTIEEQIRRRAYELYQERSRRAYELYEARGREDRRELDDWLQAEAEIIDTQRKTTTA